MRLTDPEVSILKALAHLPTDDGDGVSIESLARDRRNMAVRQIHETLHSLSEKNLIRLREERSSAVIAEAGVAALASV